MRTACSSSIALSRASLPRRAAVNEQRFRNLIADTKHRVERGHRFLEDQGDLRAADLAHRRLAELEQVAALEQDPAAGDAAGRLHQPHDRQSGHRLAAPRFADQPERLAGVDLEADLVDGRDRDGGRFPPAGSGRIEHRCQAFNSKQRFHQTVAVSAYSPNTSRRVSAISPTVALASTAATIGTTRFCPSRAAVDTAASAR